MREPRPWGLGSVSLGPHCRGLSRTSVTPRRPAIDPRSFYKTLFSVRPVDGCQVAQSQDRTRVSASLTSLTTVWILHTPAARFQMGMIPIGDDNSGRTITPFVTYLLIVANIAVFVLLQGMGTSDRFTYAF